MVTRVPSRDLYADLGVTAAASPEAISVAFRAMARRLHPDTNPDATTAERFKVVSAAYRVLSDPVERLRYDATRADRPAAVVPEARAQPMVLGWPMTRRRAHWVLTAGIACLVLAVAVTAWVVADPGADGADQTGRTVTLWLVAAKLLVGGLVAVLLGTRRLRDPLR